MIQTAKSNDVTVKNNAKSNWATYAIQEGITLMTFDHQQKEQITLEVNARVAQYFFCLDGHVQMAFGEKGYALSLTKGESYFFYNPQKKLVPTLSAEGKCRIVAIFCTLEKIHALFLRHVDKLSFLSNENVDQKYYQKDRIPSTLEIALNQILKPDVTGHALEVYHFAKVLEVFSLYFAAEAKENKEYCPYLNDESSVRKIKQAKEILIENMSEPPTISALAQRVELNEFRLKEGFKSLYGTTLFNYLLEYKMNTGRRLLDKGGVKVQDVAYQLGYNNPSHFISAFKNKYGMTPKKYIQNK